MNSSITNATNETTVINYLRDETIVYLPYLILNCIGVFVGIIGKQYFVIDRGEIFNQDLIDLNLRISRLSYSIRYYISHSGTYYLSNSTKYLFFVYEN